MSSKSRSTPKSKTKPITKSINLEDHSYYFNRDLSWLAFNSRVLEEAADPTNPLMERLKFLSIVSSNLDEFFMVRVANLKDLLKEGFNKIDNKSGLTTRELLIEITKRTHTLVERQYDELTNRVIPALEEQGIHFVRAEDLSKEQEQYINQLFQSRFFPVLTPMAIDASRPFPMLQNGSLNLAVRLTKSKEEQSMDTLAVVPVPSLLPRFIPLPSSSEEHYFILLEHVLKNNLHHLFPGYELISAHTFRITRNARLPLNEEVEDFLEEMEKELRKQRMGYAVRLEIEEDSNQVAREFLTESLEIEELDIYCVKGPLDLTFLMPFSGLEGFDHVRWDPWYPRRPHELKGEENIYKAISKKDILLHHPYESFEPVVHFIRTAAEDPQVLAIKQTLYRVGRNSPLVDALAKAAENGKQVTVLVELKARFDEENNIGWAKKLEEAGCHVIYGLIGLKTHCKISMVVREEGEIIKRYVHMGTGNYNQKTARLYTDFGLFTSRNEVGEDATLFFNHLTGYVDNPEFHKIIPSPDEMRKHFLQLIQNETQISSPERPGRIIAKMNSLTDKEIIKALYTASQANVQIDLIVRGICCLRPGVEGVSGNIRVISIVGRFLEHSRIYYFGNAGEELIYLASADWMTRNMVRRVELLIPIQDEQHKRRLLEILSIYLRDNVKARELQSDGSYQRVRTGKPALESQGYFQNLFNR
ncbi:RNA degradosome polyphosphate kinase [Brevibacillus sp. SYSU BS000544]|uniref:RNA degradosome polyphosphate kinase n=1 Tax=Brevibacillus sp. SYSU BS000544 TaxID=3416443 RepID=UPI003CE4976B